ncbi:hypothetical protein QLX08_011656 [Tetragonisca angustula]|uniref:Uncharacterized protein n=4 Tax=Meliponini TaxID=83319 RepID=A0AA40G2L7_9HYME|nr:hypothetical protein K0M31_019083 [Melipona bicolor]
MDMVREKPRRRSVSELLDWRCVVRNKGDVNTDDTCMNVPFLEDYDKDPEMRRRKRSGTWP